MAEKLMKLEQGLLSRLLGSDCRISGTWWRHMNPVVANLNNLRPFIMLLVLYLFQ